MCQKDQEVQREWQGGLGRTEQEGFGGLERGPFPLDMLNCKCLKTPQSQNKGRALTVRKEPTTKYANFEILIHV